MILQSDADEPERRCEIVRLLSCRRCGAHAISRIAFDVPGGPPRPSDVRELVTWLDAAWEPAARPGGPEPDDAECPACGAPSSSSSPVGARAVVPMIGSGSDLVAERMSGDTVFAFYRLPLDGSARPIAAPLDDACIERAFERPFSLATAIRPMIARAADGHESLEEIEPGLRFFAGPREDGTLDARVAELAARAPTYVVPLSRVASEALLGRWVGAHAAAIAAGELRAGLAVDAAHLAELVARGLATRGIASRREDGVVIATRGETQWPAELVIVLAQGAARGLLLAEIADEAANALRHRVERIEAWRSALAIARPDARLSVDSGRMTVSSASGERGRALDLATMWTSVPTPAAVARVARFAFGEVPAFADATRLCPCGASAIVVEHVLPWPRVESALGDAPSGSLAVTAQWPSPEKPRVASVVAIACDAHLRFATAEELSGIGPEAGALERRVARDLAERVFSVDVVATRRDLGAVVVRGSGAAAIFAHDGSCAALHETLGSPIGSRAHALCAAPDVMALAAPDVDLDAVHAWVAAAVSGDARWIVARDADLSAPPIGRIVLAG